ncbi:MAG: 50S ribosomal protein L35 [Clostridia bacterium]|nr:50S ribosomal protein L35 [Oscillospiraceae bacterium]MBQ2749674.1 50S ribosomal protein L35 [Clostridia bacterium]MBQ4625551.1 50S ribosomal protein L35 [Clostridia bacterium]MBR4865720.1 50S ribosomal protein L35 [Clostridia bacterium]
MPKLKTSKTAAKRFSFTKNGKVKMKHSKMNHNTGLKNTKIKRGLRKVAIASESNVKAIRKMMPYS